MKTQSNKRLGCWLRIPGIFLLATVVILVTGKLYTDAIVDNAESKYPPSEYITVENVRLHYLEAGSGRPVVFLGGGSSKIQDFSLSPLFEPSVAQYRVLLFDRPGLGYSEKPANEDMTPGAQARLLHTAIVQLDVEKPVILGQSWGGIIALAYADSYPDELSGIVLLGSSPYPREWRTDLFDAIAQVPALGDLLVHTVYVPIGRHLLVPTLIEQDKTYFAPLDAVPPSYYDVTLELGLRPSHLLAAAEETRVIPVSLATLSEAFDRIEVPVVIVVGDQDTYAIQQAPRLQADLPNCRTMIVEGVNHYLWYSQPDVVIEALEEIWMCADQYGTS